MRTQLRVALLITLLLFLPTTVLAAGQLLITDPAGRLDQRRVETAAAPLLARGALVAVYLVDSGDDADFTARLTADGLLRDDLMRSETLAIYVAFDDRYSAVAYGDAYESALGVNRNFERIRADILNPALADGNVTDGIVATLAAFEAAIANPPSRVGGLQIIFDSLPIVIGVIVLAGAAVALVFAVRLRRSHQTALQRERALREARETAGGVIVAIGLRLRAADEEVAFDRVSFPAAMVEQLEQALVPLRTLFQQQQQQFDEIGERLNRERKPPVELMTWAVAGYQAVTEALTPLPAQLDAVAGRRNDYRARLQELQAAVAALAPRQAGVADKAAAFAVELSADDDLVAPLQRLIDAASASLQTNDADAVQQAIAAADQALTETAALLTELTVARRDLVEGRHGLLALESAGYRVEAAHDHYDRARALQHEVLQALVRDDRAAARQTLDQAVSTLQEAQTLGLGLPDLRAANDQRITALAERGPQMQVRLSAGRAAFDLVDEFAESTWRDIAGNGSEAEAAFELAQDHWESARSRNTLEVQEFAAAAAELTAAEDEIAHVERLIGAIEQRLRDLEQARLTARSVMDEARRSIEVGQRYLSEHDREVGQLPADQLQAAAATLTEADTEAQQPQPDWLRLLALAQQADQLADAALADAGAQVAATERIQQRFSEAAQTASAAIGRVEQYVSVHGADLDAARARDTADLRSRLTDLRSGVERQQQLEDLALRRALGAAAQQAQQIQRAADDVFTAAESDVQAVEGLRSQVNTALTDATEQVQRMRQTLQFTSNPAMLQRAAAVETRLRGIALPLNGRERLTAALLEAQQISAEARAIADAVLPVAQSAPSAQATSSVGDVVAGLVIGALLSGGGHRSHGGWGNSRSWSSPRSHGGSSSWGRTGGGGGSFGGSRGGGSFGGGRHGGKW